ncbi:uncharacterized protein P8A3.02c [Coffea arabica]|uniref:Uncharacterized protein P8A3.02c n=1 Tax=Coffea arabica TaxID=13443 RepID=A0ABM4VPE5_COFAR|nr:alkylated DNA repair protein alkB homolog 8-like isoform X1 [Coffea arabica]
MEEEVRMLLQDAFGELSDGEGGEEAQERKSQDLNKLSIFGEIQNWERIDQIKGLWLCRDFLSPDQQSSLLSAIQKEGWLSEFSGNQAMRFGNLPQWAIELSNSIKEAVFVGHYLSESMNLPTHDKGKEAYPLPPELLWREPLFDQLIVNTYQPGEGICAHVDLMRFEDGIAILSLESSCVMHFSLVEDELSDYREEKAGKNSSSAKIPVLLTEGSLVLMWGEARYFWKHEINRKPGFQRWMGQEIDQRKRTSITLRKLC